MRGLREARTAAALNHEGIVSVYDLFEHDGRAWIVMEYVPGQSLADLIRDGARLEADRVAHLGAQVAAAVAAAHRVGIVHRDIKPGNVLVTPDGQAKLTDFGIARAQHDQALTRTGLVSGRAGYFSPELAQGGDPSSASDVWALGATLYAAVEGRPPHPSRANPLAMLREIATHPPRPPEHAGPLEPVLSGLMQPDPAQRWSAEQGASALREVAVSRPVTGPSAPWLAVASPADPDAATQPVPREDTRVLPGQPAAGAAGAGALGAGALGATSVGVAAAGQGAAVSSAGGRDRLPPGRRPGRAPAWLIALPLMALLLLGGWALAQGNGTGDPAAGTGPPAQTDSAAESGSEAAATGTTTGETDGSPPAPVVAPPSVAEVERAARDYYRTAPKRPDQAWELVLPQAQVDREDFDGRWADVSRADLQDLTVKGERATAEVLYRGKGGAQVARTEALSFARDESGTVRISSLEVISEDDAGGGNGDEGEDEDGNGDR